MRKNVKNLLKKTMAFLLAAVTFLTTSGYDGLEVLAEEVEKTYENLEGYTMDIKVSFSISDALKEEYGNDGTIQSISGFPTSVPVVVHFGKEDQYATALDTTMTISGTTGTIKDVPVYIVSGTGSLAAGGTGKYTVENNFYYVELGENTVLDGLYNLQFNGSSGSAALINGVTVTADANELIWSAATSKGILVSMRDTREYSYTVTFMGEDAMSSFPATLKSRMQLKYIENGETKYVEPSIVSNGNSTFTVIYEKVPSDSDIDATVMAKLGCYGGYGIYYQNAAGDYATYSVSKTWYYDSISNLDGKDFIYIENTSLTGSVVWQDSADASERLTTDQLKNYIQVYDDNNAVVSVDASSLSLESDPSDATGNTWQLTVSNLPLYSPTGTALHYYYKIDKDLSGKTIATSDYYYRINYDNGLLSTSTDYAISGCTIYMVLSKDNYNYEVDVVWQDDSYGNKRDSAVESGITLYLWRGTSSDFSKAAAVCDTDGNQYYYTLQASDVKDAGGTYIDLDRFTQADLRSDNLPYYNEIGQKYIYFVTMISSDKYYEVSYYTRTASYALMGTDNSNNENCIYMTRVGEGSIKASVDWTKAQGETDYIGSTATLLLQYRVKGSSDEWQDVTETDSDGNTVTVTAVTPKASENQKTVTARFYGVNLYSDEGKTYEFRVLEQKLSASSGGTSTSISWMTDGTMAKTDGNFTYQGHGYKAEASYTDTDSDGSVIYKICNILSYEMEYRISVYWSYNFTNALPTDSTYTETTAIEAYQTMLDDLITPGTGTCNFTGDDPVKYIIQRKTANTTASNYALLTVLSAEDNKITFRVEPYNSDDGSAVTYTTGTITNGSTHSDGTTWTFRGIDVPKYDDDGYKYTYTISTANCEHDELNSYVNSTFSGLNRSYSVNLTYDTSGNSVNTASITHYLYSTGTAKYVTATVKWVDKLTDEAKRTATAELIAIYKNGDDYYLVKDMGGFNSALNPANSFSSYKYFNDLKQTEIDTLVENSTLLTSLNDSERITVDNILYVPVETSISYNGTTYTLPWYDADTLCVNKDLLQTDTTLDTPILYDSSNPQNIKLNGYQIIAKTALPTNSNYASRTFQNSLVSTDMDIHVQVTFKDSDNISGYRGDMFRVYLYRSTGGSERRVQDGDGNDLVLAWTNASHTGNVYTGNFTNLPLYDDNSRPYTYSIRQYLVKDGVETLIDENATSQDTQTHYVMTMETVNGVSSDVTSKGSVYNASLSLNQIDPADYKTTADYTVVNTAGNDSYEADFYVIWHDEDAYSNKSRADMVYTLYYSLDGGTTKAAYSLGDYDMVVKTADTGVTSNPYYQKLHFTGLKEFTDQGAKITYYVQQTRANTSNSLYKYQVTYSAYTCDDLVNSSTPISNVLGIRTYHRELPDTAKDLVTLDADATPTSACFIAENQVIQNALTGSVNVKGAKQWVNMSEDAIKPTCTVYLFRSSKYDTALSLDSQGSNLENRNSNELLVGQPTDGTYVAKTTITDPYTSYSFKTGASLTGFDKYDEYGVAYEYLTAELITDANGNRLDFYVMQGKNLGDNTLVNTFDPESGANSRSFTIKKNWALNGASIAAGTEPNAKFYVYRVECNYTDDSVYPTIATVDYKKVLTNIGSSVAANLKTQAANTSNKKVTLVDTFTMAYSDSETSHVESNLDICSPSGLPYIYIVVEDDSYSSSYSITNGGVTDYSSLSDVTAASGYSAASNVAVVSNYGVALGADNSTANSAAQVTFTNTLKTYKIMQLTGKITWSEGDTCIKTTARPSVTGSACPDISMTVSRYAYTQSGLSNKNTMTWETVTDSSSIEWTDNEDGTWTYVITYTGGLDQYAHNGNPYYYRVAESFTSGCVTAKNYQIVSNYRQKCSTSATKVDETTLRLSFDTIYNKLGGTYTVKKSWIDGYDSYGLRPAKSLMLYEYSADNGTTWIPLTYASTGKAVTKEVSKSGSWTNSFSGFPVTDAAGISYKYRVVEIAIGYSSGKWVATTDIDVSAYTTTDGLTISASSWDFNASAYNSTQTVVTSTQNFANVFGSVSTYGSYQILYLDSRDRTAKAVTGCTFANYGTTNTSTVTNYLNKAIYLTVTKNWTDDENALNMRPDSIKLMVQMRKWKDESGNEIMNSVWTDCSTTPVVMKNDTSLNTDAGKWVKKFSNLPQFDEEGNYMQYRVVEVATDASGNTVYIDDRALSSGTVAYAGTYDNYKTTAYSYNPQDTSFAVTMTNALDATETITVNKTWEIAGGNTAAAAAGYSSKVQLTLYYKNASGETKAVVSNLITLNSTNSYTKTLSNVPSYIVTTEDDSRTTWTFDSATIKETAVTMTNEDTVSYEDDSENAYLDEAGNTVGIYTDTDSEEKTYLVHTSRVTTGTQITLSVTNTELTSHSLEITYAGDTDLNTAYATRPTSVTGKLQYRLTGDRAWTDIAADSAFAKALLDSVAYANLESSANGDKGQIIKVKNLPAYVNVSGTIKAYEYRIIETSDTFGSGDSSSTLTVSYDTSDTLLTTGSFGLATVVSSPTANTYETDRSIGGYTYAYVDQDNQSSSSYTVAQTAATTYLTKKLLTAKVVGAKLWSDQSDKYHTRPSMDAAQTTQTSSSPVQISIYKGSSNTALSGLTITWSQDGSNANQWNYTTEAVLPKYASGSQSPETYKVVETTCPDDYTTDAGTSATAVGLDSLAAGTSAGYALVDITNTLKPTSLSVSKTWSVADVTGITPVSATFTLQAMGADGTYSNVQEYSSGSAKDVTCTINYEAGRTSSYTFTQLPVCDNAGNTISYRILETSYVVSMKDTANSYADTDITFALEADGSAYKVKQKIAANAATAFSTTAVQGLTTSTSDFSTAISFNYGLVKTSVKLTGTTYAYTNTARTASANATVTWSEQVNGSQDATLRSNFRPTGLDLILQTRISEDGGTWSEYSATVTAKLAGKTVSSDKQTDSYSASSANGTSGLPIYALVGNQIKTYEYRIVEKSFVYKNGSTAIGAGDRSLYYAQTGGIGADFDSASSNVLACSDKDSSDRIFYTGSQTNSVSDYVFTTAIANTLATADLNSQVKTSLSGTVTWLDNSNELGKRPNSLTMVLRVQSGSSKTAYGTANFTLSSTSAFTGSLTHITDSAGLTVTCDLKGNTAETWTYTITNLPLYDENGNYLTYSVCQTAANGDYVGQADSFLTGQKTDSAAAVTGFSKYAFGTAKDQKNAYDVTTDKIVTCVDFVESMNTKVIIQKTWAEGSQYWQTRPDLNVMVQSRVAADVTAANNSSNATAFDREGSFATDSASRTDSSVYLKLTGGTASADGNTYTYTLTRPQYTVTRTAGTYTASYGLLQYRVAEIGKNSAGTDVLLDHLSDEVKENANITSAGTDHLGSYYLSTYSCSMDSTTDAGTGLSAGYSRVFMTNTLDQRRSSIVVKKEWITSGGTPGATSVTVTLVGYVAADKDDDIAVADSFNIVLNASNNWTVSYSDLPLYDRNFKAITWEVREIKVDSVEMQEASLITGETCGLTTDDKWLATYSKEESTDAYGNTTLTFTVSNVQTLSGGASLAVTYQDDLSDAYSTRAAASYAELQYRVADSGDAWAPVAGNLAKLTHADAGNEFVKNGETIEGVLQKKTSSTASYTYEFTSLPLYHKIGDTVQQLEYRVVEIKQGSKEVAYVTDAADSTASLHASDMKLIAIAQNASGDREALGYTYTYSYGIKQSTATLVKELLKTTVTGTKTWVDSSDKYGTRPAISATQAGSSAVKVTLAETKVTNLTTVQPVITWTDNGDDTWTYTSGDLPKYESGSDTPAAYTVTESCSSGAYTTTSDAYNFTNTLAAISITVDKTWVNSYNATLNTPAYNAVFQLYSSTDGGSSWTAVTDSSFDPQKTMSMSGTQQLTWTGLPVKAADGSEIRYKVEEDADQAAGEKYEVISQKTTDADGNISYTITNRQLMDFTVEKLWVDTLEGIKETADHKYVAEGVLQYKIGTDGSWTTLSDKTWRIEETYSQTLATTGDTYNTYTFTDLPRYDTVSGDRIYYQALETKINGIDVTVESNDYAIAYEHSDGGSIITNTLNRIGFEITKLDRTSGEPMANVTFTLTNSADSTDTYTGTTDTEGKLTLQVLRPGTYVLSETRVQGYEQYSDSTVTFTENDIHKTITKTVYNTRKLGSLTIHKVDSATGDSISNVKFALYQEQTGGTFSRIWNFLTGKNYTYLGSYTADASGYTTITGIPWGNYYIVEEQADGYILKSSKYKFTVDSITVENSLALVDEAGQTLTDNRITNEKNSFTFQKQSVTGLVLTGGSYALYAIDAQGRETQTGAAFTVEEGATSVQIQGTKAGKYCIRELTAPDNYLINEDPVYLYITEDGKILQAQNGAAWTGSQVVMTDIAYCSLTVTKNFNDGIWADTFRPDTVTLKLYSYTDASYTTGKTEVETGTITGITTGTDSYTYTFDRLPMYLSDGSRIYYRAEEVDADPIYTVTYADPAESDNGAGASYTETITNTIEAGDKLYVTKQFDLNLPAAKNFAFTVTMGADADHMHTYRGTYTTGTYDDLTMDFDGSTDSAVASAASPIKIKRGVTFMVQLPQNAVYSAEEILSATTPEYQCTISTDENNSNHLIAVNTKEMYTGIDNETKNREKGVDDADQETNAGGTVALVDPQTFADFDVDADEHDLQDFAEGKLGLYWKADENWVLNPNFTILYTEHSEDDSEVDAQTIEVTGYIDDDGNLVTDATQVIGTSRYDQYRIYQSEDKSAILLYLADSTDGMPYKTDVRVSFLPTVAIINTTAATLPAGGKVSCDGSVYRDNSAGKNQNNDSRYVNKTVLYATADEGYCLDLTSLSIGNVGDIALRESTASAETAAVSAEAYTGDVTVSVNGDLTFSKTLTYTMGGVEKQYEISGKLVPIALDEDGNITSARIELDRLSIPVDVGIAFKTVEKATEQLPEDKNPKTGDASAAAAWVALMTAGFALAIVGLRRRKRFFETNR